MVYLSEGNRRMKIPTFSLISEYSCPNATPLCKKYCYAKKAERAYKNVFISRMANTFDSFKATFISDMKAILLHENNTYIRIHESGDFYSQEYLDKWFKICNQFPEKRFLAYSQMYNLDWSNKPKNMVVYWTIWTDSKILPKKGLKAYVIDNGKGKIPEYKIKPRGHLCCKGHGSNLTCDKCLFCFEGKGNVIFKIH
jgi:hypothetical protein